MVIALRNNGRPALYMASAAMIGAGLMYLLLNTQTVGPVTAPPPVLAQASTDCHIATTWVKGFAHVQPLLSLEPLCASPRFAPLRNTIALQADSMRASGLINAASVYVCDLTRSDWTSYNGDERFDPGSMLKVPLLICYMAMAEEDPTIMKRTFRCEDVDQGVPQNTVFPDKQATFGTTYTVEQLLELSIVHSDNRATAMLLRHMRPERYLDLYADLGLPRPDWKAKKYILTAKDCSVFLKALYTSPMLSPVNAERALQLMFRSTFEHGLVAGLPADVEIAHKFGESGDPVERQLHETGLVFLKNKPYLITVMTKGPDTRKLAESLGIFARTVHQYMTVL